jgi:3-oxoacyl-[acyl-carrier-protein] synthase III
LALHDAIQEETINGGDSLVFCISGSGQSTGTALYVLDDLPERMRSPTQANEIADDQDSLMLPLQLEIESLGIAEHPLADEPDTVQLITKAAESCLANSNYQREEVDLFIAACTYRSEFLMEPAIAALAAGELKINDDRDPEDVPKTFAFDVANGEVGFLKSVFLAAELTRAGRVARTLVAASEVENNITRRPDHLLGVRSMASAIILRESEGEGGFLAFGFKDYAEHVQLREVHAGWHEEGTRVYLTCNEQPQTWETMQKCLVLATKEFLAAQEYSATEIDWFLPTQHSSKSIQEIAAQLGIDRSKLIDLEPDRLGNPLSSLFPLALSRGMAAKQFKPGDKILIASVCPGLQVGCAIYRT